jgi:hypothetical protein
MKNLTTKNPQGKWWTYGTYNPSNKNGREVVGIKISKEFKELINSINEGDYINFLVVEKKERKEGVASYSRSVAESGGTRETNNGGYGSDEIPF